MAFHEVRFPDDISRGARGGPERRTQVVELASGDEERNASWADSRRRYDAAYGIRRADDLAAVIAFFEARNGRLHGFRWKDWGDYRSGLPSAPVTPIDQALGTGDGDTETFQLVKRYESGAQAGSGGSSSRSPARAGRARRRRAAPAGRSTRRPGRHLRHRARAGVLVTAGFEFDVPCASTPTGSTSPGTSTGSARSPRSRSWRCGDERGARLRRRRPARPRRSTAAILAAWGALGGATNALTTRMRLRDAVRHILLGGIIAAGMGSFSMALVARWLGLPPRRCRPAAPPARPPTCRRVRTGGDRGDARPHPRHSIRDGPDA